MTSTMDTLRKDRPMSMDENGLSFLSGHTDWRAKYEEVLDMLSETKAELDEFHHASKELEAELEAELSRTEKAQQDLKVKVSKAETERDEWKSKFMSFQTAHNTTTTSLQRELDRMRQDYQLIKVQLRDLEMGNDDLERNERAVSSSLADMEAKYSRVLEEKIMLEQELLEKVNLEEGSQRLKDELRDANEEISMLRNRLTEAADSAERTAADLKKQQSIQMPPPPSAENLLKTAPPADLDLSDLSPISSSPSPQLSTPKYNALTKSTTHSALKRSGLYNRESPLNGLRAAGFVRSATMSTLYSPSSSASSRLPTRGTPVRVATSNSFTSTSSTSTTSKNKGVQMVSEMRARVRNLEQKIHTRVPRLRMASITGRTSISSTTSNGPSSSSASNASTAKTSWESQRPSPESRKSSESFDKPGKKDGGDSGWVLIMEDSPSPNKDRERERKERRRLSNPTAPTSFRTNRAPSPSLSTGPSYLGMTSSAAAVRRPTSRLSAAGGPSISPNGRPSSRPTSPTFIPLPTSAYGLKRSTGPNGPNPYTQLTRGSLSASTRALPSEYRNRSTAHPPLPKSDPENEAGKALPQPPSSNVTVRPSKSMTSNAVSSLLSKSRIGRPSAGRKSGGDANGNLDIKDLRPRSGTTSGFFGN